MSPERIAEIRTILADSGRTPENARQGIALFDGHFKPGTPNALTPAERWCIGAPAFVAELLDEVERLQSEVKTAADESSRAGALAKEVDRLAGEVDRLSAHIRSARSALDAL